MSRKFFRRNCSHRLRLLIGRNVARFRETEANQGEVYVSLTVDFGIFDGRLNLTGVIGLKGKGLLVDTTDLLRGKCSAKSLESVIPLDARDDDFNTFHAK